MKKYLSISFIILNSILYSQYTYVPDTNFENYLESNGMGDGIPENGQVLTANIENVLELNVSMMQISDLTGIEDFTALQELGCAFNQITTLDLSQNHNLRILGCQVNSLTSLTLNNENLTALVCFENYLTAIDLSNSSLLDYVDLEFNYLEAIDVTNNPEITYLSVAQNEISEIDLSQNEALEIFGCGHNSISGLDLSNNHNLIGVGLGFLPNLSFVDMRNGNNQNVNFFTSYGTSNLPCIYVDNADADYLEGWFKDDFTHFVNNEQECAEMSIEESLTAKTMIYPNPVKDILYIKNSHNSLISNIRLVDIMGKLIFENNVSENTLQIDMKLYSKGLYILQIEYVDGTAQTKKIIKQ